MSMLCCSVNVVVDYCADNSIIWRQRGGLRTEWTCRKEKRVSDKSKSLRQRPWDLHAARYVRGKPLSRCGGELPDKNAGGTATDYSLIEKVFGSQERWWVPWGLSRVAGGMAAWGFNFLLIGGVLVPLSLKALHINISSLSMAEKPSFLLLIQLAETISGILVIQAVTRPFISELRRMDSSNSPWFTLVSPKKKMFGFQDGWLTWALLGYLSSFPVVGGTVQLNNWLDELAHQAGSYPEKAAGTIDSVLPLITGGNGSGTFQLFIVAAILAPILEEYVFRGFLLPSLTKWVPVPASVMISALAFALAHLAPRDFFELFALGLVLGFTYSRTRCLATPILIHGLWNGGVLALLTALTTLGFDIEKMIAQ